MMAIYIFRGLISMCVLFFSCPSSFTAGAYFVPPTKRALYAMHIEHSTRSQLSHSCNPVANYSYNVMCHFIFIILCHSMAFSSESNNNYAVCAMIRHNNKLERANEKKIINKKNARDIRMKTMKMILVKMCMHIAHVVKHHILRCSRIEAKWSENGRWKTIQTDMKLWEVLQREGGREMRRQGGFI